MSLLLGLGLILMFVAGSIFMYNLMLYRYPNIKNILPERAHASEQPRRPRPGYWQ